MSWLPGGRLLGLGLLVARQQLVMPSQGDRKSKLRKSCFSFTGS